MYLAQLASRAMQTSDLDWARTGVI